ncbi:hypothetical protein [Snodgrassella alvi]|jgi:uncharacterized membrane protein|uniref:hypothetical protein n=1 Tax=Snodgrassella alvi TaxID=1196083 RepID=UPI000C1DEFFB|nr:hypothetical protein [Snodgrassella alvi]PIT14630.1 hypothetical protein BGI30_03090 [Snodgrassella alvi]PIT49964.1 hypothetical protein BHC51_01445 [Snodgrassella alvi]PIT57519.1 hypothetical protein BHC59_03710 [Snodgrassella alvi]
MEKEYTAEAFIWRFLFSLNAFFIGFPCFVIGIVGVDNNGSFPILRLLHVLPMPQNMDSDAAICFSLGVMAFVATIIFLIMIYGWLFNVCSSKYLKILVVIGCCCGIPNAVLCLSVGTMSFGIGMLILPAVILSVYLTIWYFKNRSGDGMSQS